MDPVLLSFPPENNVVVSNPAATLQSSIKLEQLVDLVKRISLQDLYNQTNVQLETGAVASEHHGDNETEGIKPMEFHIKADDEDAAGSNQVGIAVSRPSRARQLTEKGRKYQAELVLEKRTKAMTRLQRKARAIDDLLYSATNHVAVKEELGQYSDSFKLLSTYHEGYCELVDADDPKHQVNWFDDLDQDVFSFKHKIHNRLKESDNKSSRPSSRGISRSKKSSGSTKFSGSSKSSTQLKLLEEKAKMAELESEATFMMEKQKASPAEIKSWPQLKPADGAAYRRFYNFLLKCESATYGQNWNTIDTQK